MDKATLSQFGIDLDSNHCEHPWAYASFMLQKVSRTFALNIEVLPKRLRNPVLLAYLFCRIADTIEDDPILKAEQKESLLETFAQIFRPDQQQKNFSRQERMERIDAFGQQLPEHWKTNPDDYHHLCLHADWVLILVQEYPPAIRQVIAQCVVEMCEGMALFAQRQTPQQGEWLIIHHEEDLDQYCYFVAGVVGNMLCDLFHLRSAWIHADLHKAMRKLSVSFGLGLQITNILKDVGEDSTRQVCFLPQTWLKEQGFEHPAELFSQQPVNPMALPLAQRLIEKAWKHLSDAKDFTLCIPRLEPRLRLFCLWPLLMATETLQAVGDGKRIFDPEDKVKISRATVKKIVKQSTCWQWNNTWIRRRLKKNRPQFLS